MGFLAVRQWNWRRRTWKKVQPPPGVVIRIEDFASGWRISLWFWMRRVGQAHDAWPTTLPYGFWLWGFADFKKAPCRLVECMDYRCEATSVEGFVQQLASNYLPHGYWFYVTGVVPEGKDPRLIDRKLIEKYGIGISRQSRARRKAAGHANLHYLRFERFFVLVATHGHHPFFEAEGDGIRDVRRIPIQFHGYSVSVKRGHFLEKHSPDEAAVPDGRYRVRVQIARERYRELKAYFHEMATRHSVERHSRELWGVPFEPYAPVRRQMLNILRVLNQARRVAGLERLSPAVLRYQRRIVRPFELSVGPAPGTRITSSNREPCVALHPFPIRREQTTIQQRRP